MTASLQAALELLDKLYGELRGLYERGDFPIEDIVRIMIDTMKLIVEITVHLNGPVR